jgi:hypothetical protein
VDRRTGYRVLAGSLGVVCMVVGGMLTLGFFRYQMPGSTPALPTGPIGFYFVAFAGCALVGWGGGLLGAARRPDAGRTVGTATAVALVLMAVVRMTAWVIGDYHAWGQLPRIEAAILLLLAAAFVWLRPPARAVS